MKKLFGTLIVLLMFLTPSTALARGGHGGGHGGGHAHSSLAKVQMEFMTRVRMLENLILLILTQQAKLKKDLISLEIQNLKR